MPRSGAARGAAEPEGGHVKRGLWAVVAVVVGAGTGLLPASAGAAPQQGTPESDIGITADTIRIAVIADVDNAARPGLFQGSVNGVQAFAKFINKGKLAGRKVQVDFIDSKLSADEARNAVIRACQQDFAIVGTTALFLANIDPMLSCPDREGKATGLPDVPELQTTVEHQCSPISFPVIAGQLDCSTKAQHPQTYHTRQGNVQYHLKKNKGLHGVWLIPSDLQSTVNATLPVIAGAKDAGIKEDEQFKVSGLATQSDYTPPVQAIKQKDTTYALSGLDYKGTVFLRKEATVQGVSSVKVWDCTLQCYDRRLFSEGGQDVEGEYVSTFFIPLEEAKQNKSVNNYLKNTGGIEKADGFGAQAWAAGLFFRDVVNAVVKADGNNGLTRARFLEEAAKIHDFTADGMLGPTDVGGHKLNGCFVMSQVKGGKFTRVYPKKKGN